MFKAYYLKKRFGFLDGKLNAWKATGFIRYLESQCVRKTASFYGERGNFYIDSSDGVNEDLGIKEYCGSIINIVDDSDGKKFLVFKTSYSPSHTSEARKVALESNSDIVPFFVMCHYSDFYSYTLRRRKKLLKLRRATKKKYDIGFCAGLEPYKFPQPDSDDKRISWMDKYYYGVGTGGDGGYYRINTRRDLYDKLENSRFKFFHREKIKYSKYIRKSFEWKICLNPPGLGEYTARMLEHSALGQAIVLRKNSYDNAISYKEHFPEVDFNKEGWEDNLQRIVDNYEYWEERSLEYYDTVYDSETAITDYMLKKLKEYGIC